MEKYDFDLIVVGGGGAGITAAMMASGLGKRTAMLDKRKFGGECTWTGCVPSKALLRSARVAHLSGEAGKYGLRTDGTGRVFQKNVMDGVRGIIGAVYEGEGAGRFHERGIEAVEEAEISFADAHTVNVNGRTMTSDKFIICTGSAPMVPPIRGLESLPYLTNETLFSLNKLPESMIILGGGPIGVEMATAFNRLGASVTLVEMAPTILAREDPELVEMLAARMVHEGVTLIEGAKVVEAAADSGGVALTIEAKGAGPRLTAGALLVAAGRRPNTEGLDLESAEVSFDSKGIKVDGYLRTTAKNVYAAGDVIGPYQFSHIANYQAIVAVSNAVLPLRRRARYDHVPWCVFSDPELARSGLTEQEAAARHGNAIRVYRVPYSGIDRAVTDRAETGLAKFICGKRGNILGIHILGERAGEVMHEAHAAKALGIPLYRLDRVIHAYPCYNDAVKQAARSAYIDRVLGNPLVKLVKLLRRSK